MSRWICLPICFFAILLSLSPLTYSAAQTTPKPLRRAEVLALVGGQALPANIVHAIRTRGLSFRPTDEYRAQLRTAGADASVLTAVDQAKHPDSANSSDKWEQQLLQSLTRAAERIQKKCYDDAVGDLTAALGAGVDVPEAGFVMAGILREKEEWTQAATVYTEVLREDPNFPEAHTKLSYILYRLEDSDSAFREAKAALAENPDNAEAHKNLGLALFMAGKRDAALLEYREALRLKPDYGSVHFNIALLLEQQHDPEGAVAEYRKAAQLDPNVADFRYALGTALGENGDRDNAIRELREAKRLDPTRLDIRHNLAVNLEHRDMHAAVTEFLELEKMAPNFQLCQKCLAYALHYIGDDKASVQRYRRAAELDPYDPDVPLQLGEILEEQKNYDGALAAFRKAEEMSEGYSAAHLAVGRVLLTKKEYADALQELRKAAALSPADAPTHEVLARALRDSGDTEAALAEFKEAQALDPKMSSATLGVAQLLEKKGDWPGALDRYRQAALAEAAFDRADHHGQAFLSSNEARSQYRAAQIRLEEHIQSLKAAGKTKEAAELQSRVNGTQAAGGTTVQLQELMQAGDEARGARRFPDAEKAYQKAVELAEKSAPSSELLITALEDLGGVQGLRQNYTDADATLHRALALSEKDSGVGPGRAVHPLQLLAGNALGQKDFAAAEKYASRALELSEKDLGDTNPQVSDCLRLLATVYLLQQSYDKAKPYLVRAVDLNEKLFGAQDFRTVMPLYSLCMVEDHVDGPEKTADCYRRLIAGMEVVYGASSPSILAALNGYAQSLRRLGRTDEAVKVEQRAESIRTVAQQH